MEIRRRQFEMSRVLNIIEDKGWIEAERRVEGERITLSVRKDLKGLGAEERRLAIEYLLTMIGVFGWTEESSRLDGDMAEVSVFKIVVSEVVEEVPE